nr:MAG TPA: hypothetical protein [Caudoviricetes sp.]
MTGYGVQSFTKMISPRYSSLNQSRSTDRTLNANRL